MKGRITANLGESRYTVEVVVDNPLLTAELTKAQETYTKASERVTATLAAEQRAQAVYDEALIAARSKQAAYDDERRSKSIDDFIEAEMDRCRAVYDACTDQCQQAREACTDRCTKAHGECLQGCSDQACADRCNETRDDCQQGCYDDEDDCLSDCAKARERCEEQAELVGQQAYQAFLADCFKRHSPGIQAAQKATLDKLPDLQEAVFTHHAAEVDKLAAAQRLTELQRIDTTAPAITLWSAQYNDALAVGAEVTIARTPAGNHVITTPDLASADTQPIDARIFPASLLFINAALAPGVETWTPSWRTGTVQAVGGSTLTVAIDGGTMTGTLGTVVSRAPIDCTPPQAYFDGQVDESAITTARAALVAAQRELDAIATARKECPERWKMSDCYEPKSTACKDLWGAWLVDCLDSELDEAACHATYEQALAACQAQALAECQDAQAADLKACLDEHPIEAARAAVLSAQADLQRALANLRDPASPLILPLPVAHCTPAGYKVDDRVLIDFPQRNASQEDPMAVWKSARVVGWAESTRRCGVTAKYRIGTRVDDCSFEVNTHHWQEYETKVDVGMDGPLVWAWPPLDFHSWSDGRTDNPRQDLNITDDIDVTANFQVGAGHMWKHPCVVGGWCFGEYYAVEPTDDFIPAEEYRGFTWLWPDGMQRDDERFVVPEAANKYELYNRIFEWMLCDHGVVYGGSGYKDPYYRFYYIKNKITCVDRASIPYVAGWRRVYTKGGWLYIP